MKKNIFRLDKLWKIFLAAALFLGIFSGGNIYAAEAETEVKDIQPRLSLNHQNVCTGGAGGKIGENNPNNTGKPNQNADNTEKKFYNPNAQSVTSKSLTEQEMINLIWPKKNDALAKETLGDAVIDPADSCYYSNVRNNFENLVSGGNQYIKYNTEWVTVDTTWGGNTPGPKINSKWTGYAGNYIYFIKWKNWKNPFTIVTNAVVGLDSKTNYYVGATGARRDMPMVYDMTNGTSSPTDPSKNIYVFKGKDGVNASYVNQYPTVIGKYDLEVQTAANKELFRLPGSASKSINILPKGYSVVFKMGTDKNSAVEMNDSNWNENQKPDAVNEEVKNKFNINMYLENTTYRIPKPKIDEKKYIFEGWTVYEEYVDGNDGFKVKTREITLTEDSNGMYNYKTSFIGENATYILNTEVFAKYRARKVQTVNAVDQVINGKEVDDAVSVNPASQKLVEGIDTPKAFQSYIKPGYAYEFVGWSSTSTGHSDLGTGNAYTPKTDYNAQSELEKSISLYATYQPKSYNIIFDANGGEESNSTAEKIKTQSARYYNHINLDKNVFTRDGYTFVGWSKTKDSKVAEYHDQASVYNLPINGNEKNSNDTIPDKVTLYAVWKRGVPEVKITKYKDTLLINGQSSNLYTNGFYLSGSSQNYNGAELIRYYLEVEGVADQSTLDSSKFSVVWERKKVGQNSFVKQAVDMNTPYLIPLVNGLGGKNKKVFWDEQEHKWFVPLIIRLNAGISQDSAAGDFKLNVAYDDPTSTVDIGSESEFYSGTNTTGWYTSEVTTVRVIDNLKSMVSIPAEVYMSDVKEKQSDGTTKEVIKSKDVTVTVNKLSHKNTNGDEDENSADYNWSTPNTAHDGDRKEGYTNSDHEHYKNNKAFKLAVEWNNTLTSSSGEIIDDVYMYDSNTDSKKIDMTGSFIYDNAVDVKQVFSFYLKGSKPEHIRSGTLFKGIIHFKLTNV